MLGAWFTNGHIVGWGARSVGQSQERCGPERNVVRLFGLDELSNWKRERRGMREEEEEGKNICKAALVTKRGG